MRTAKRIALTVLIAAVVIGGIITAPQPAACVAAWMLGGLYAEV